MAHGLPAHARLCHRHRLQHCRHGIGAARQLDGVWNSLPPVDKAALEAATLQEFHASCAEARAHDAIARKTLASRYGVAFASFPADIAEAVKRVADTTVAHVAGRDAKSRNALTRAIWPSRTAIADTPGSAG